MINKERLKINAQKYGIRLSDKMLEQFELYSNKLLAFNSHTNLTAITDDEGIENKHFLDSLLLAAQPEIDGRVLDIGSGAGFPGVPIKLFRPTANVVLLESNGKKARFLKELIDALNIKINIINNRAEDEARAEINREKFDIVTARAVARMNILSEYCLPFVKQGGWFIAMKGDATEDELAESETAIHVLGGKVEKVLRSTLPDTSSRQLVFIRKVAPTPAKYPRNAGAIKKRPL